MRRNHLTVVGAALLVFMVLPGGMLFGVTPHSAFALTSRTANWYDSEQATDILNQMQTLAAKARHALGPLRVQETDLNWKAQADMLDTAKHDVDMMGKDLLQLDNMRGKLEPWQQSLISKVTPNVHEMVYQLDQAIAEINKYQDAVRLSLTQYPQNIAIFSKSANRIAGTIGTVDQYVQADEKMAALERSSAPARS